MYTLLGFNQVFHLLVRKSLKKIFWTNKRLKKHFSQIKSLIKLDTNRNAYLFKKIHLFVSIS